MKVYKAFLVIALILISSINSYGTSSKTEIIKNARESIVRIINFERPFFDDRNLYSSGTGYIVGDQGLIVTNYHVIEDAKGLISFAPHSENPGPFYCVPLWSDSTLDLAVLKAYNCQLPPLRMADNDSVKLGHEVLILGYPGAAYKNDMIKASWGIVSSNPSDSTIQTNASVNPGNSGGPAINMNGEVIGTVFAKSVGLSVEGLGFIRNNRFLDAVIDSVRNIKLEEIDHLGTKSIEAYEGLCNTLHSSMWIKEYIDIEDKVSHIDSSLIWLSDAISVDPDYVNARYYKTMYLLNKAIFKCDQYLYPEADDLAELILKEYKKYKIAKKKADRLARKDSTDWDPEEDEDDEYHDGFREDEEEEDSNSSMLKFFITELIDEDGFQCRKWLYISDYMESLQSERDKRIDEFANYLKSGKYPKRLNKAMYGTYGDTYYGDEKMYNSYFRGMAAAAFFSTSFVLSTDTYNTERILNHSLDFQLEPLRSFFVLLDLKINPLDILTSGSDYSGSSSDALRTTVKIFPVIGIHFGGITVKYSFMNDNHTSVSEWLLMYGSKLPGIGYGNRKSIYYFGIGVTIRDEMFNESLEMLAGWEYNIFNRNWIKAKIGFVGIHDAVIFLNLGFGIRY